MDKNERKVLFKDFLRIAAGHRHGFNDLMEWLESTDFFDAPASSKYHGAREGALVEHSLNVRYRISKYIAEYKMRYKGNPYSADIVALLHDVCKIGRYKYDPEKGIYKTVMDDLPIGHGERSVILIQQHMTLTKEEIVAIRWHMGAFDDAFKGGANREMSEAFNKYPLAVMLHLADMEAAYLEERD